MADRNIWDPKTPPGFLDFTKSGFAVELFIYRFPASARDDTEIRDDVLSASDIWCQGNINIQAVYLDKLLPLPPSEPVNLSLPDVAGQFACGSLSDAARNQFFSIARPGNPDITKSIAVFYLPGNRFQDGATGCHQFRFQGIDGKPEHIILLTDRADGRALAHELGHALFTRSPNPGQWINDDPDPQQDASKIHNKDPKNLMFPSVPADPVITSFQSSQSQQSNLTHKQGLAFGFKENKPFTLGVKFKTLKVYSSSDEATSDDALESSWTLKTSIVRASDNMELVSCSHDWGMDPLHWYEYTLDLDCPSLVVSSDDDKLVISVSGTDFDVGPNDDLPKVTDNWEKQQNFWGSDSTESTDPNISTSQKGDHVRRQSSSDIDYSLTYHIRMDDRPIETIFRNVCDLPA